MRQTRGTIQVIPQERLDEALAPCQAQGDIVAVGGIHIARLLDGKDRQQAHSQ